MMRLGAVRAMALDTGGSTTLAFDGTLLNRPSDGRERPIATALMLLYSGVYASPPATPVVSPNGDGVDDSQKLSFRIVRPSTTTVTLQAPDGGVALQETGLRQPGVYRVAFPPPATSQPTGSQRTASVPVPEGQWKLTVSATDDESQASTATRRFTVNSTLGFLRVSPRSLLLPPHGRPVRISWTQARPARVTVRVTTTSGTLVRTIVRRTYAVGRNSAIWTGFRKDGRRAVGGRYQVTVTAENDLGSVSLAEPLLIRRTA
jgi:hypothetical protein